MPRRHRNVLGALHLLSHGSGRIELKLNVPAALGPELNLTRGDVDVDVRLLRAVPEHADRLRWLEDDDVTPRLGDDLNGSIAVVRHPEPHERNLCRGGRASRRKHWIS